MTANMPTIEFRLIYKLGRTKQHAKFISLRAAMTFLKYAKQNNYKILKTIES